MRRTLVLVLAGLVGFGCASSNDKANAPAGTAPTAAAMPGDDDREELRALRHGVRCDGKTDDSEALQKVVDSARLPGNVGRRIILPVGTCVISKTITIRSIAGLVMQGQGVFVTDLQWRGPADQPLILLDHGYRVTLADFSITPAKRTPLKAGIRITHSPGGCEGAAGQLAGGASAGGDEDGDDNDAPTPARGRGKGGDVARCGLWPSTTNTLRDIVMRGQGRLEIGVHVHLVDPNADRKNDHHRFERVQVTNYTGSGFVLEGRNAKALTLTGCMCQGKDVGKSCVDTTPIPRHGASFWWYGGLAQGNTVADFDIGDRNDTLLLSGVYSEKSARFLRVQDRSHDKAMPFPVVIEAARFATSDRTAADGEVIQFLSSGPLTVSGSRWGVDGPESRPVRFRFDPPGDPAAARAAPGARARSGAAASTSAEDAGFVFTGNYVTGPETAPFPARSPSTNTGNIVKAEQKRRGP